MLALKDFDFWPREAQDIEKPASAARTYEFIWRVPLASQKWAVSQERIEVTYPFHFRYQPARLGLNTTEVPYPGPPRVFLDCTGKSL